MGDEHHAVKRKGSGRRAAVEEFLLFFCFVSISETVGVVWFSLNFSSF
jgi:hypothetical protein